MKPLRKHPDDGVRSVVQRDCLSDRIRSSAEALLPGSIAQQDSARCAGQVLTIAKIPSQHRGDTQHAKESVAHGRAVCLLCAGGGVQQKTGVIVGLQRTEYLVELFPVEVVEI